MAQSAFKKDEIILLLGAGASVEAKIPDSREMIERIEGLIQEQKEPWNEFQDLYNFVKSSIYFAEGLNGSFVSSVSFNVERLVDTLQELETREGHPLSPFVAAWDRRLADGKGGGSELIGKFRRQIIGELRRRWVELSEVERASYFSELRRFQSEFQYPLRVFSLNYDLCVEKACGNENVQRGFDGRFWDWRAFEETAGEGLPLLLYKLHGSLDWQTGTDGRVRYVDAPSTIEDDDVAIVFGASYKRQYVDPFLFLAYEFRRWTLDAAKVIVCIGYSFSDEHINDILAQSLRQDDQRQLVAVFGPAAEVEERQDAVSRALGVEKRRVKVVAKGAKDYMESDLTIAELSKLLPSDEGDDIPQLE